ncbi:MAG: TetR/AcrR family transcriptional regulator [Phormidesmis sp.]
MTSSDKTDKTSRKKPGKHNPEKAKTILMGALQVFSTQGYAAASMDRIATAAGVSKPTLYSYFKDKPGLFVALIKQTTQIADQTLKGMQSGPVSKLPPDQALRTLAMTALNQFSTNPQLPTMMRLIIGESERFPELAQTFVQEVQKPLLGRLEAYFAAQPQLNVSDPAVAARMFAGSLMHYIIVQEILSGKEILPLSHERMVDGLVAQMMAGTKPSE